MNKSVKLKIPYKNNLKNAFNQKGDRMKNILNNRLKKKVFVPVIAAVVVVACAVTTVCAFETKEESPLSAEAEAPTEPPNKVLTEAPAEPKVRSFISRFSAGGFPD